MAKIRDFLDIWAYVKTLKYYSDWKHLNLSLPAFLGGLVNLNVIRKVKNEF